ncbi:LytR family transcriptional regulator [Bacillus cereus]|uniref:polyisoprenyl-teichoic acid--peptidoglycan teichoic acid transferase TagU n=1 Tax=Bacillus cereus TaxID=1396 RepID=UPI000BFB3093|nr:LytR family transcriptional regulator [Bacillus cereus]PGT99303.1 LytR family transcriptional regulator [Bacillus cereus]
MRKKIKIWIFSILGTIAIVAVAYTYNIYGAVTKTLDAVHKPLKSDGDKEILNIDKNEPISILLVGADERGNDKGRSDSLMVLTLNPKQQSMKTISIPRDTYTEIIGKSKKDKINHAYAFGGVDMSVATVSGFLDIPIQYYIEVNMEGFKDIVDAVDGVDINNDLAFSLEGHQFRKGNIHLNGEEALAFVRMRKEDPRGDFGRQMRQRQIMQAIIKKGSSFSSLENYNDILTVIQKNIKTNLTQEQMFHMQRNYKGCLENSEDIQIQGEGHKAADGIWYYYVPEHERINLSNKLKAHLRL